ncbi:FG-GAP repeat protein [Enhygromyxa salina]|uniref:FG-GAP repeat protein n=2 Tax=Enhygromyxa salina TaxID=215803 RepID=A0A2S9YQE9_9BACT|nr:FG-GAP repeat protein [Enhygromyxa salina]
MLSALGGLSCFDGVGTVGAVCEVDQQCGLDQSCDNSVCGVCGDGTIQPGELCFGASSEENVFGEVTDLLAFDPEGDGFPLLIATVNSNCANPPMTGPPTAQGDSCWDVFALVADDDNFEAINGLDPENKRDGRVPQASSGNFDGSGTSDIALAVFPNDPLVDPSQLVIAYNFGVDPVAMIEEIDISLQVRSIHAADMNGDGLDDLLVGGQLSSSLALYIAQPGVGFEAERLLVTLPAPRPAPPVDMDNDGDLDVVLISELEPSVRVELNNGAGMLTPQPRLMIESPLVPRDVATADFDRDGNVDVVVFISAPFNQTEILSEVRVYRGLGDGSLELQATLPGGELPISGVAADVNFDGWPDIVVADIQEDKLPVHINRAGSFPDFVTIDVAAAPRALMFEDFNLDDVPDLVIGNANGVVAVVPSEN